MSELYERMTDPGVFRVQSALGVLQLNATFTPDAFQAPESVNLVSAPGYDRVYNTAPRGKTPTPMQLKGEVRFETSAERAVWMDYAERVLNAATTLDGGAFGPQAVLFGFQTPSLVEGEGAYAANVTITLIPARRDWRL